MIHYFYSLKRFSFKMFMLSFAFLHNKNYSSTNND